METFKLSTRSKENRAGVDSRLIEIDDLAITLTLVDYGHDEYAGLRTTETQASLFEQGKSQKDGVNRRSYHQDGKALDFYAYVNGRASYHHPHLAMVACAYFQAASILGYRIRWGGLFKATNPEYIDNISYGWDMAHIELLE
jgi:peptidoglycan L-alanyl-D-glutamate endopeptidase CwlK